MWVTGISGQPFDCDHVHLTWEKAAAAMTRLLNAREYLLDQRITAGDRPRIALTGPAGDLSYAALHDQLYRTAAGPATTERNQARALIDHERPPSRARRFGFWTTG